MVRSVEATNFFTISLKGLMFYLVVQWFLNPFSGLPFSLFLGVVIKYLLTAKLVNLIFKPLLDEILRALKLFLGLGLYDTIGKNTNSSKIVPLISICMDHSGLTEGILIASGKWFIISTMAMKLEQSAMCGLVLAFSIISLFTSTGEPLRDRTDDSPPLKQNVYFTGEPHENRQRSAPVLKLFWLCSLLIRITGGAVTIWIAYRFLSGYTTSSVILILGITSSLAIYTGGIILFKKLWFVVICIMGLCEGFLDENTIVPFIIISIVSMFTICILTNGWDYDRTGVSDGLAVTYALRMVLFLTNSEPPLQLITCVLTLAFVVTSKFTEPPVEKQS
ncbi:hypothetical protein MKW98_016752 [Papaver atlanticum]|uniref:Uncharacterized protein n=1 Tax=Papaver atlanticum TaxID=357466 RepID=A0AAD4TGN9_9MAGN|nr:hypothetical protein MKW98_016752 [Papaver atlanticum]